MDKDAKKRAKARAKQAQKRAKTQEKLDKLMSTISTYSLQTDALKDELLANDGKIDEKEQKRLDKIEKRIAKVITKVNQLRAKMGAQPTSKKDDKREALSKELQDFHSYLENMASVFYTPNDSYPTT